MTKTKICKKCGNPYPITSEYFYENTGSKDGYRNSCKICERLRSKKFQQREDVKERKRINAENLAKTGLTYKKCSGCKYSKPLTSDYYSKSSYSNDGFYNRCKVCQSIYFKNYSISNAKKLSLKKKEYRSTECGRNAIRAAMKKYNRSEKGKLTQKRFKESKKLC